jgi:hypothetical protein
MPTNRTRRGPRRVNELTELQFDVLGLGGIPLRRGDAEIWCEQFGDRLPRLLHDFVLHHPEPDRLRRRWRYQRGGPVPDWWPEQLKDFDGT